MRGLSLENLIERALIPLLCFFVLGALFWVSATLTLDYYDSFEYFVSGLAWIGQPWQIYPKNIQHIYLDGFLESLSLAFGRWPSLAYFHLTFYFIHLCAIIVLCFAVRKIFPRLGFASILLLGLSNRLWIHYAPFSLPDLTCVLWISSWFYLELSLENVGRAGIWGKGILMALLALNRPHAVLILVVALFWITFRERRNWRRCVCECALAIAIYLAVFSHFFAALNNLSLMDGFHRGVQFFSGYAADVNNQGVQPPYVYLQYFYYSLGAFGILAFCIGLAALIVPPASFAKIARHPKECLPAIVQGLLLGALAYALLLLCISQKEARYLIPILPAWLLVMSYGLCALKEVSPKACLLLILCLSWVIFPELNRFLDPIYRDIAPKLAAERIEKWSLSKNVAFIGTMAAFYPRESYFHWNERYFYFYHWWVKNYIFYTGKLALPMRRVAFEKYGFPIPDGIETLAPPGVTLVAPAEKFLTTENALPGIGAIYAVRWFPLADAKMKNIACSERVKNVCVEVFSAFDGIERNSP